MTMPHEPDPTTIVPAPVTPSSARGPVPGETTTLPGEATPWDADEAAPATPVTPVDGEPARVAPVPTSPVVVAAARHRSGAFLNVLLAVALAVAVGGVAFAIGRSTASPTAAAANGGFVTNGGATGNGADRSGGPGGSFAPDPGRPAFAGPRLFGAGGLSINGMVTAVNGDQLTVKTANGNEVTVALDDQTTYHTAMTATAGDVTVGSTVDVQVDRPGRVLANGSGDTGNGNGNGNGGRRELTAGDVTVRE